MDEVQAPTTPTMPPVGSRWMLDNMPELNGMICEARSPHARSRTRRHLYRHTHAYRCSHGKVINAR
jgi:hypothetical protein